VQFGQQRSVMFASRQLATGFPGYQRKQSHAFSSVIAIL
jgi:hypothetical protein